MIQNLFTVYDEKAHAYLPPFFMPQRGQAVRVFTDCINSKEHQFGNHPHDYTLFHLGEWDDNTARFKVKTPSSMGNGLEFLSPVTDDDLFKEEEGHEIGDDSQVQSGTQSGNSA